MICMNCGREVRPVHFYKASGQPRCWSRFWTLPQRYKLMEHWEHGLSDAQIAVKMGTTENAVHLARKRYKITPTHMNRDVMNAREVQRLLGIGCSKLVARWCELGWLKGRRGDNHGPYRIWRITRAAVETFLADESHWQDWNPERITDERLRWWALGIRGGERFLTLGQAARYFNVERDTVGQWIDKGWIAGYRPGMRGNHLVKQSDVERLAPTYVWGNGLKVAA
jgi:excisionase family DNA binding protein